MAPRLEEPIMMFKFSPPGFVPGFNVKEEDDEVPGFNVRQVRVVG